MTANGFTVSQPKTTSTLPVFPAPAMSLTSLQVCGQSTTLAGMAGLS
jgi:hypothetical protein